MTTRKASRLIGETITHLGLTWRLLAVSRDGWATLARDGREWFCRVKDIAEVLRVIS